MQVSRLLEAHEHILIRARAAAHRADDRGDDGTNDLYVSDILRKLSLTRRGQVSAYLTTRRQRPDA